MKINQVNQQQNQKNIQNIENKEIDIKMQSSQQVKIKVHDDNDKLDMLGDGNKRKETFESMQEFVTKKERIYNLDISKSFVDRHFLIMNNIKSIISDSVGDVSFEERKNNQEKIDGYTRDLKSISMNINAKLKTEKFDPAKLGIKGVLSIAQMGKITIKSRKGRSETIMIYYTPGSANKTIKVDLDKNTGDIRFSGMDKFENVTNKVVKEILEEQGYETDVNKGDLDKKFIDGIDGFNLEDVPNLVIENQKELSNLAKPVNNIENKIKFNFIKTEEIIGLSVINKEDASESLDKIDNALGVAKESKLEMAHLEYKLELEFKRLSNNFFGEDNIRSVNDAVDKVKETKEKIFKENNFLRYLENVKDPGLVYKLLK